MHVNYWIAYGEIGQPVISNHFSHIILKVQSSKFYNNNYMIASTQITNIAVLVFKLLSPI